jgi:hypothetical protein
MRSILMVAFVLLWVPVQAAADAVPSAENCPPGASPRYGHAGPFCEVAPACDWSCDADLVCRPFGHCLANVHVVGGTAYGPFDAKIVAVVGTCGVPGSCEPSLPIESAGYGTASMVGTPFCVLADRCVAPEPNASCSARSSGSSGVLVACGVILALALRRRR